MNNTAKQTASFEAPPTPEEQLELFKLADQIDDFLKKSKKKESKLSRVKSFLRKVVFARRLKREAKIAALKRQLYAIATEMTKVFEAYREALNGVGAIEQLGNRAPDQRVRARYNKEYKARIGQAMMYMSALDQSLSYYLAIRHELTIMTPEAIDRWNPITHPDLKPMVNAIEDYRKDCEAAGLLKQN